MPKIKTKKIIAKRFRLTKKGKLLRKQGFKRHLNTKKSANKKRSLSRVVKTHKTWAKKIKRGLSK
jgi:LSU ribosomal protein L35P